MPVQESVQARYAEALEAFVEKARADACLVAVILVGSLSHDVVWEKSDIDLMVIVDEGRAGKGSESAFSLVERGINIHACVLTRSAFKRQAEGSLQSSFMHSFLNHGRLLFTHDETIRDLFESRDHLGLRDREVQLLRAAGGVLLPCLAKAEKWLRVKEDPDYSCLWIMKCVDGLATIETLIHGEVTGREVIYQALRHNPQFFRAIYTDLLRGEKNHAAVEGVLRLIEGYLMERAPLLFKPLLQYLAEAGGPRSATELNHYFANQMNLEGVDMACEWLADQGIIRKMAVPVRLTTKSKVLFDEAAYYYEGEGADAYDDRYSRR
jgi:hypothetical protein